MKILVQTLLLIIVAAHLAYAQDLLHTGSVNCKECHQLEYDHWNNNHEAAGVSCESCHGPGMAHSRSNDVGFIDLPVLPTDATRLCAPCHNGIEASLITFDHIQSFHK